MISPKDVLVLTTSTADNLPVKKYLKPVSAHLVAGTNLFSDFFGGLTDVFGGRSDSYQRQLASLYNDAIDQIKIAAYEIGANCVLGLSIDMDEISGKGKSMFMLTAVGTAVVVDKGSQAQTVQPSEKLENVSAERLQVLKKIKQTLHAANEKTLVLDDEIWEFITANQVDGIFTFLVSKFRETLQNESFNPEAALKFRKQLTGFLEMLLNEKRTQLLYDTLIETADENMALKLSKIIQELHLFDHQRVLQMLSHDNFNVQKRAINIAICNKPFYNAGDYAGLNAVIDKIEVTFTQRGTITTKKQLLSSKEKEVWICECGKTNDFDTIHCHGCSKDIKGFKNNEIKPEMAREYLLQRISLIEESLA